MILNKVFKSLTKWSLIALGVYVAYGLGATALNYVFSDHSLVKSSVKITNFSRRSGGSGVILSSNNITSQILTNSHVCNVVKNGGYVRSSTGEYMVESYKTSKEHDMCLINVNNNLKVNTTLAPYPPTLGYEEAFISGHPNLYPNVITKGHVSGKEAIQVFTGVKQCTEEDYKDPNNFFFCYLFGGLPILQIYEATLVTATIMPGSSGSGVFNSANELIGLVFAGQGDLGFAWTVPHQYVYRFVNEELPTLEIKKPLLTTSINGKPVKVDTESYQYICASDHLVKPSISLAIKNFCSTISNDLIYRGIE